MVAGLIASALSLTGRIGLATVSQYISLVFALTLTGFALLIASVLSYLLNPTRSDANAIKR